MPCIRLENVNVTVQSHIGPVQILNDVNLEIADGEFVAVMGNPRAGKSTLLRLMGCLERPTDGSVYIDGLCVSSMTDDELADMRTSTVGLIHPSPNSCQEIDTYYKKFPILLMEEPYQIEDGVFPNIMARLKQLNVAGATVIFVTHDPVIGVMADRVIRLDQGAIQD